MAIATLIEKIVGRQRERQAAQSADFRGIVAQIADGKEPDADLVAQALRDADQPLDSLKTAVETLQRRRELRKKWDAIPQLTTQRQKLEQQIAETNGELKAAEKKHYHTICPLWADLDRLKEAGQEAEKAGQELVDTCTDQDLLDKVADMKIRLSARWAEATELRRRIAIFQDWARNERGEAERCKRIIDGNGDTQVKLHLARAKEHDRKAADLEAALTKINRIVSSLEGEEARIREQMRVP